MRSAGWRPAPGSGNGTDAEEVVLDKWRIRSRPRVALEIRA
ncbi:MAG: hypothetical protein ACM36C_04000 [Acidobacteriota bacterium]